MPYIHVATNLSMDDGRARELNAGLSALAAELLGKPEKYVLARFSQGGVLTHGGTADPAAMVELKSIGLPEDRTAELSDRICAHLKQELGISPDKVYIEFLDLKRNLFGWNSGTF
jgi:phenylpyruvate tautomerase PptA (4-oxalocrotonate tautomerase family)